MPLVFHSSPRTFRGFSTRCASNFINARTWFYCRQIAGADRLPTRTCRRIDFVPLSPSWCVWAGGEGARGAVVPAGLVRADAPALEIVCTPVPHRLESRLHRMEFGTPKSGKQNAQIRPVFCVDWKKTPKKGQKFKNCCISSSVLCYLRLLLFKISCCLNSGDLSDNSKGGKPIPKVTNLAFKGDNPIRENLCSAFSNGIFLPLYFFAFLLVAAEDCLTCITRMREAELRQAAFSSGAWERVHEAGAIEI